MDSIANAGTSLLHFLAVIALAFAALYLCLVFPARLKFIRELRQKSRQELEAMAFAFHVPYFDYIGLQQPAVVEYRELTARRDLQGIRKRWNKLNRAFLKLERSADHRGRPLLMDYYDSYELVLKELARRR